MNNLIFKTDWNKEVSLFFDMGDYDKPLNNSQKLSGIEFRSKHSHRERSGCQDEINWIYNSEIPQIKFMIDRNIIHKFYHYPTYSQTMKNRKIIYFRRYYLVIKELIINDSFFSFLQQFQWKDYPLSKSLPHLYDSLRYKLLETEENKKQKEKEIEDLFNFVKPILKC